MGDRADGRAAKPATIIEVAALAGVSKSTVSSVIRGADTVSERTRERVLAAIERLEYRPNVVARQLKEQRSTTIGVLLGNLDNPFYAEMAMLVERRAFAAGYTVMFCNVESDDRGEAGVEALLQQRLAGILFLELSHRTRAMRERLERHVPTVFVGLRGEWGDSVAVDDGRAGRLATEHLLALGHRRIAYLGTPAVDRGADRARGGGYGRAMRAAGLEPLPVVRWEPGDDEVRIGRDTTELAALLGGSDPVTALFVSNDLAAVALLEHADRLGIRVPGDLSVVGFDNIALGALGRIALTTVAQPMQALADLGVELLVERANRVPVTEERRRLTVPAELVVRSTTAPPPHR